MISLARPLQLRWKVRHSENGELRFLLALALIPLSFPVLAEKDIITPEATAAGVGEEAGSLETDFPPLAKWFDERFEVKFNAMSPALIFDQVPLSDIFYETSNLPLGEPSFNLGSNDI